MDSQHGLPRSIVTWVSLAGIACILVVVGMLATGCQGPGRACPAVEPVAPSAQRAESTETDRQWAVKAERLLRELRACQDESLRHPWLYATGDEWKEWQRILLWELNPAERKACFDFARALEERLHECLVSL